MQGRRAISTLGKGTDTAHDVITLACIWSAMAWSDKAAKHCCLRSPFTSTTNREAALQILHIHFEYNAFNNTRLHYCSKYNYTIEISASNHRLKDTEALWTSGEPT
jgi:hypothetical protein